MSISQEERCCAVYPNLGERIEWRSDKHPRSPPLDYLNNSEPHYLCPDHQCEVSNNENRHPCQDVVFQGGPQDLEQRGQRVSSSLRFFSPADAGQGT